MHSSTVIKCLDQIFSLCGMLRYIHSDRGTSYLSQELKEYLSQRGIATSKSTPYHPIGNGQVERYNGIIWKTVRLSLKSKNLLTPNGRLSFQMLCIPSDRSSRLRQTLHRMRDSSASSVAHPVAHRCPHGCIPQSCSGDSSKMIVLWIE